MQDIKTGYTRPHSQNVDVDKDFVKKILVLTIVIMLMSMVGGAYDIVSNFFSASKDLSEALLLLDLCLSPIKGGLWIFLMYKLARKLYDTK